MTKILDITGFLGGILLALTLLWVGKYNIQHDQIRKGIMFILVGILIGIIMSKELLSPLLP